jgi:thymidylate synthase ThyX
MAWEVRVECDSISPSGVRLTSVVATYPLIIHNELLTHRAFSRSSASNRAIPTNKLIEMVRADPFIPAHFAVNIPGMRAGEVMIGEHMKAARDEWLDGLLHACMTSYRLAKRGVHKQWANRPMMPYQWITTIITSVEWDNFFKLRCHPDAQPEIRKLAEMIRDARQASQPKLLDYGYWHMPFIDIERDGFTPVDGVPHMATIGKDTTIYDLRRIASARCARVSYLSHDGKHSPEADMSLFQKLTEADPRHLGPLEHVAACDPFATRSTAKNFEVEWAQFRTEWSFGA